MRISPDSIAVLHALADPTRVQILDHLARAPAGVTELSRHLPITRQGTAKHLTILRDAGLVRADPAGPETRYRVQTEAVKDIARTLAEAENAWSRQLDLLKDAAEDIV